MSELPEDRVFARHPRVRGAVLIVGTGAVGGFVAEELAAIGISPLWLVDKELLDVENLVRHPLGDDDRGPPKAVALAQRIRRDRPWCDAHGWHTNFLELSADEQRWLVDQADVVVAATGDPDCQRRVNRICIARGVEKPAVYPGVWVDPRVRDAEVGDILWVLPGRHTPCYECWTAGRGAPSDARAARGARVDIQQVSLATANIVRALLNPRDERSAILDPDATAIYVHGLSPRSPGVQDVFPIDGLYSRNVRVSFPPTPCRACGGHEHPRQTQPPEPAVLSVWRGGNPYLRRRLIQIAVSLTLAALFLTTAVWAVNQLTGSTPAPAAIPAPTSKSATAPAQTTPPSSGQSADSEPPPAALESSAPVTEQPTPQAPRAVLPAGLHTTCKYTIGDGVFVGCPARFPRTEFFTVRLIVVGLDRDVWDPLEAEGYALHFVWPSGGKRVVDDCTYVTPPDNVHCDMPLIADEFPFTSGIIITDPGGDIIKNLEYPLG